MNNETLALLKIIELGTKQVSTETGATIFLRGAVPQAGQLLE